MNRRASVLTRREYCVASLVTVTGTSSALAAPRPPAGVMTAVILRMISCDADSGVSDVHLRMYRNAPAQGNPNDESARPQTSGVIQLGDFHADHQEHRFNLVLFSKIIKTGADNMTVEMWDNGKLRLLDCGVTPCTLLVGQIFFSNDGGGKLRVPGFFSKGPYLDTDHPQWVSYRFTGGGASYKVDFDVRSTPVLG